MPHRRARRGRAGADVAQDGDREQVRAELRAAFEAVDADGDGTISMEELVDSLSFLQLHPRISWQEYQQLLVPYMANRASEEDAALEEDPLAWDTLIKKAEWFKNWKTQHMPKLG